MDHITAYIDNATVEDELIGREQEPDEMFLRSVEEKLSIPEDRKDDFRQEVSNWVSRRAREGTSFNPQDNDRLRRALERKLWEDKKHNINFSALVSANELDDGEHAVLGNMEILNDLADDLQTIAADRGKAEKLIWFDGSTATDKSELEWCLVNSLWKYSKADTGWRYTVEWNIANVTDTRGLFYANEVDHHTRCPADMHSKLLVDDSTHLNLGVTMETPKFKCIQPGSVYNRLSHYGRNCKPPSSCESVAPS